MWIVLRQKNSPSLHSQWTASPLCPNFPLQLTFFPFILIFSVTRSKTFQEMWLFTSFYQMPRLFISFDVTNIRHEDSAKTVLKCPTRTHCWVFESEGLVILVSTVAATGRLSSPAVAEGRRLSTSNQVFADRCSCWTAFGFRSVKSSAVAAAGRISASDLLKLPPLRMSGGFQLPIC